MDRKWIASTGTLIKIHRLEDPEKSFDPYPQKKWNWSLVRAQQNDQQYPDCWSLKCLQLSKDLLGPGQFKKHSSTIASAITESWRFTKLSVFRGELCESHIISCSCLVFPWSHRVSHHIYHILSYFKNFRTTETILRTAPNPILLRSAWQHHTARWDLRSDPVNGVLPVQGGAGTPIILKAQPEPHHKVTTKS